MNAATQRDEELFDAARRLEEPDQRRAFLDRECAGDPERRTRVEGLLNVAAEAEQFFTESRSAISEPLAQLRSAAVPPGGGSGGPAEAPGEEPIGARIGRYKLLEKIGEGGCGVVYLADQEEPVRRRVALKIIKLGMETRSVISRFEAERQALAMMDHPNIARVFDAGATDRGPPFFVMELVRGVRITEYCDQHRLDVRQRLDLFIQICHAIQHAHQKGIVHRDIKPSNIMVTLQDGAPVPKVIDFGIAKAIEARLTDRAVLTANAQLIGTPAYMSPEQADLGRTDIDTRSDIYSLGVLLYELLTGRTPLDGRALVAAGLDEMRRILREREPPRPSLRLQGLPPAELAKTADSRRTEPTRLISLLRGDLDWVVMKTLEKDRTRRYETANGLAMDLHRHLANEPVSARPPSRLYRFQKLVRRNRVVFAAGAAVAAALVAGTGTSTWLLIKEREARHRAVAAEQQEARLRREAEVRERLTQAALLVSQDRFDEADNLLGRMALAQPTVEGAAVYRAVGEWHALHERWKPAADRFTQLVEINQLDGIDLATLDYLELGPALVELGDTGAYERFRQAAITRFSGTPGPFADRIVKISLLLPAGRRLVDSLAPLGAATVQALKEADAAGDIFVASWRSVSLALLEYRRGSYAQAEEWCQKCLTYPEYNAPRTATARVILALSSQQLGQAPQARAELERARQIIDAKFRTRLDRGTPVQGFWFDWEFARILLREAASSIEMGASPP